jgi:hypothetical protein
MARALQSRGDMPQLPRHSLARIVVTACPTQLLLIESNRETVMKVMRVCEAHRPEWRINVVRDRAAALRAIEARCFDAVVVELGEIGAAMGPSLLLAHLDELVNDHAPISERIAS